MKKLSLILILLLGTLSCTKKEEATGRIYFFGNLFGSPGINIFSVDLDKALLQHTAERGSRDVDMALDEEGNMVFASNRVLREEGSEKIKENRRPSGLKRGAPQDFNVFYLKKGVLETEGEHLATPVEKTDATETQSNISPDGKWISFVRTERDEENKAHERLVVVNKTTGESKDIVSSDLIIKTDWSADSKNLLFSAHDYREDEDDKALLARYDIEAREVNVLLENPWEQSQIDSPQWSPDGEKISMVSHPSGRKGVRQLYVYDLESEKMTLISGEDVQVQVPVSWTNDSQQVAFGALVNYRQYWHDEYRRKLYEGGAQIFVSNMAGESRQLTSGETEMHNRPVFSPNNKLIAYMYAEEAPGKVMSLRVMDLNGKLLDTLYDKVAGVGHLVWHDSESAVGQ